MFGTLRRIASLAAAAIGLISSTKATVPTTRYAGPPIPLLRSHPGSICRTIFVGASGGKRNRVKGKRDHSLKVRSNRRKASAKRKAA
jgi:hypothetical protein